SLPYHCRGYSIVPNRAHSGAKQPVHPPHWLVAEKPCRHADVADDANRADRVEQKQTLQERDTAEPLNPICHLFCWERIDRHGDKRSNYLGGSEMETFNT